MPDDHSNTIAGATEITLDTGFSGTLDYVRDSDKFAIALTAGQTYRFEFEMLDNAFSWLDLYLLDADGNSVLEAGDTSFTAMTFRAQVSGTYYISVDHFEDYDGYFSYLGAYTGQVQAIADDYPTNALPSDGAINIGDSVNGMFDYQDDIDEVRINTEAKGLYRISIDSSADRLTLGLDQTSGSGSVKLSLEDNYEMYFVANSDDPVEFSLQGSSGVNYSYTVERVGTDDHSALEAQATQLSNGDVLDGNIAFELDKDVFELSGTAGATYLLTIDLTDHATLDGLWVELSQFDTSSPTMVRTRTETQIIYEWTQTEDMTQFLSVGLDVHRSWPSAPQGDYTVSLSVEYSDFLILGDDNDNNVLGTDQAELFRTLGGNDSVSTSEGADVVFLGDGDDYVRAGGGQEVFHGGAGHDRISYYDSLDGVHINLATNDVSGSWAADDKISGFESVDSSRTGHDVIHGTDGANTIRTYGGNDSVYAGAGNDTIHAGRSSDEIYAGDGDDKVFSGEGSDKVFLGNGNDYVRVGGGQEEFHGGDGNDYISYYDSKDGVTVNLDTNAVSGSWASNDIISGFEGISGSKNGHDTIQGTSGANKIKTFGGNDIVHAGRGDDKVYAGDGNDKVFSGVGSDKVYLGNGNDYVRVGGGQEEFHGGDGNDYISYYDSKDGVTVNLATNAVSGSWASNDIISGFEGISGSKTGHDTIHGTSGANKIKTFGGNDIVHAGRGNDKVYAGDGNDKVYSGKGSDKVYLGDGNDYVMVGGGQEEFHGGDGYDYLSYYHSRDGVTVNLETNEVSGSWASNDVISGFEGVSGSKSGHDTIRGTSGANIIKTYGGDDVVYAGAGNDKVYAGLGSDKVFLGDGNDYVLAGGGKEEFHGGDGNDYISYYHSQSGVTVNLRTNEVSGSWASNDSISGFESVSGSNTGHDTIYGSSGANVIRTYGGNDVIRAGAGNDTVYAGSGNDQVYLGDGNDFVIAGGGEDSLDGGDGHDIISYRNSETGVQIDLEANTVSGSLANGDKIANFEDAVGSNSGDDLIYGTSGRNILDGFGGSDTLYGRDGNDILNGRDGDDHLYGGAGNDLLEGGTGNNSLSGGGDADTFYFNMEIFSSGTASHAVIEDFKDDVDTIEVSSSGQVDSNIFEFAVQRGQDVVITGYGHLDITVRNTTIDALQDDFVFEMV